MAPGWLTPDRAAALLDFCRGIAEASAAAVGAGEPQASPRSEALDRMVDIAENAGMYESTASPKPTR